MNQAVLLLADTNNIGRAQFSDPLRESLRLLGNSTECHRVLIVFSDGESETELSNDIVRENNPRREVGGASEEWCIV